MSNALKVKQKAAEHITDRTGIEDAYKIVARAEDRARDYLTSELGTEVISIYWIEEAAGLLAAGAAFEQAEYAHEYDDGDSVFVDSRSYQEAHRAIGLTQLEAVLSAEYYEGEIIPAVDGAIRIAAGEIKDRITS